MPDILPGRHAFHPITASFPVIATVQEKFYRVLFRNLIHGIAMDQWVIFGFGDYISDIFDIIHANGGKIKAVIDDATLRQAEPENLEKRISLLSYEVPVVPLPDFRPGAGDRYMFGFLNTRDRVLEDLEKTYDIRFSSLVHPSAYRGENGHLGRGVCISPHAVIAPNVRIGSFTVINRACNIGHDTEIGEFCQVNPGASIAGLVTIGDRTTIGIGATVIDKIHIGTHSFVGAGAVVVNDVPDDVVVVGIPAKILKKNE
jgi:sugar O-acyltransferase (sialic acid O-acetyltransferase NeuD family)